MSDFLTLVHNLLNAGSVKISEHGYDELADDDLTVSEIMNGIKDARIVEEYPDYPKGRCILLLQKDLNGNPVHALWGIPKGQNSPLVLVTAYRPDPKRWNKTFLKRKY